MAASQDHSQAHSKPRLLLMGLRRSGKSSISSVVFHKLPPSETLYLETTTQIAKDSMTSFMDFQVWDFPAQIDYTASVFHSGILPHVGALIWVLDAQDAYFEAISRLVRTIVHLQRTHPHIHIEVFVHKVDGLSDDFRHDVFADVQTRILDELGDARCDNAPVAFYQTSIYDHSIFEAFSRVVQKLIPQPRLSALESLLNSLCATCGMQKAYLFDVLSKIYVAADTSPGDIAAYETASDYIDVIVDLSEVYGWDRPLMERETNGNAVLGVENGDDEDEEPLPLDEYGNQEAESMVVVERKGCGFLYLREVNKYLALVCIMGTDDAGDRKALIDYNVGVFQKGLNEVFTQSSAS